MLYPKGIANLWTIFMANNRHLGTTTIVTYFWALAKKKKNGTKNRNG
jgi:hypothetical protein